MKIAHIYSIYSVYDILYIQYFLQNIYFMILTSKLISISIHSKCHTSTSSTSSSKVLTLKKSEHLTKEDVKLLLEFKKIFR